MPAETEYGALPIVKLNGMPLPASVDLALEEVAVHDHLHLPDMLELRFRDEAHNMLAEAGFAVGKEVEVSATPVGRDAAERPLFKGEITALESVYEAATGSHAVVRAYDKAHRLMKHRKVEAWNQTTLAEVVRSVAGAAGLDVSTADGDVRYEYLAQVDETSWDFLQRLARETGYEVSSELGELHLRLPPPAAGAPREADVRVEPEPHQLVLGTNLRSLRVRLTAASQVPEVNVRSWDWKTRRELLGRARASTRSVQVQDRPDALAGHFNASPASTVTRPLDTQEQVDSAANSLAELIAAASAEAYGAVDGNPALKAGEAISISNSGEQFDGKYLVTASRHVFDEEGFRTHFEITGRQERSVLGLTGGAGSADHRFNGVVVGIVSNNRDPDGHARVKLKFPWLSDSLESTWARLATLDAGGDERGSLFIPEVNDEVLVAFEHGEFRRPYVLGSLWNGEDRAPAANAVDGSGQVVRRVYRSRQGHELRFSDDDSDLHVELATGDGKRKIRLDQTAKNLVLTVDRTTVTIEDTGDLKVDATGNVSVKARANLTLEAGVGLEIKAPNVKINGSGQTEIKGGTIRLN